MSYKKGGDFSLISQDFNDCEIFDIQNKNTEAIKIDIVDIDNIFEVIKEEDNIYKIIHIHKHQKNHGKFEVGDTIYLDFGMISFYTKKNGDINEISVFPTIIIKKEEILLMPVH